MISILEVKHNYGIDRLSEEYNKVEGQWQRIKATEKKMGVLQGHMIKPL
ncbi:hypothetical protein [Savagea faecisuis]|uniref:Uncharacterized protein n=1 Tax=Savagea faecisuis TaxID=1274803 RepID=A0ABW3GZR5_9BACL